MSPRKRPPLELLPPPPAPVGTFDRDTHTYTIDGIAVPSVTQVLEAERFIDFSHVPSATLTEAQARGTYVHTVLHYYLEGDYDLEDCRPEFRGYVDSGIAYLDRLQKKPLRNDRGEVIGNEYRFWHRPRMFAGTVDYLGWDADGVLSIDDFKTGEPTDVAAALQTAAYEFGVRECLLPTLPRYRGVIRRRAVKLYADGRPGRPEPYDDVRDLGIFFSALTCVHFRRNRLRQA